MARKSIPETVQTEVIVKSGRRCAICYGLHGDATIKAGQLAHLAHDPAKIRADDLCWLCLLHHAEYDSRTNQAKGFTESEVRAYRDKLYGDLPAILGSCEAKGGDVSIASNVAAGDGIHGIGGAARIEGGTGRRIG